MANQSPESPRHELHRLVREDATPEGIRREKRRLGFLGLRSLFLNTAKRDLSQAIYQGHPQETAAALLFARRHVWSFKILSPYLQAQSMERAFAKQIEKTPEEEAQIQAMGRSLASRGQDRRVVASRNAAAASLGERNVRAKERQKEYVSLGQRLAPR